MEDKENFARVIMFQNGVSFEAFPKGVISQAKGIAQEYDRTLKKEAKFRSTIKHLVLSIDSKNARALDDALSIE